MSLFPATNTCLTLSQRLIRLLLVLSLVSSNVTLDRDCYSYRPGMALTRLRQCHRLRLKIRQSSMCFVFQFFCQPTFSSNTVAALYVLTATLLQRDPSPLKTDLTKRLKMDSYFVIAIKCVFYIYLSAQF